MKFIGFFAGVIALGLTAASADVDAHNRRVAACRTSQSPQTIETCGHYRDFGSEFRSTLINALTTPSAYALSTEKSTQ